MSSENEIEEMTIGGQNLEGTEPAAEQTMEGDSPMRSVASLFGLGELAGNMQNAYMPTAAGEPQLMTLMAQGGVELHDEVADMTVMQNSPRTTFDGARPGADRLARQKHAQKPRQRRRTGHASTPRGFREGAEEVPEALSGDCRSAGGRASGSRSGELRQAGGGGVHRADGSCRRRGGGAPRVSGHGYAGVGEPAGLRRNDGKGDGWHANRAL